MFMNLAMPITIYTESTHNNMFMSQEMPSVKPMKFPTRRKIMKIAMTWTTVIRLKMRHRPMQMTKLVIMKIPLRDMPFPKI